MRKRGPRVALIASVALMTVFPVVEAQFEAPLVSKIQLNFANPGGKSLAMGGAFVSLADDATAAFSNPAGIVDQNKWTAGLSGKTFEFRPELRTGNFYQDPNAAGFSLDGVDTYHPTDRVTDLEYVSVAGPITKNISVAVYRAVNLRYSVDSSKDPSSPLGDYRLFSIVVGGSSDLSWSVDEQGAVDLGNEAYGASIGARFGAISVGAGVTLNRLKFDLTGGAAGPRHLFVVNRGVAGRELSVELGAEVTSPTRLGWSVGARWEVNERYRVNVGAVYRRSPSFDVDYTARYSGGIGSFSCEGGSDTVGDPTLCGTFKLPDDYSIGVSIAPTKNLTVAIDLQRIRYSELNESYVAFFAYRGCQDSLAPSSCSFGTSTRALAGGESDDATIPRVGAELKVPLARTSDLFIRGGYYREPAHGTRVSLFPDANSDRVRDGETPVEIRTPVFSEAHRVAYDGGSSEDHVAFGLGASVGSLSIDLGADIGSTNRFVVLSAFYRFP